LHFVLESALSLLSSGTENYRQFHLFDKAYKNTFTDYSIKIDCNSQKLEPFYGFNYADDRMTPLNIIYNENWEILPGGYIDLLKEFVCPR
jgi:hypothetical protein